MARLKVGMDGLLETAPSPGDYYLCPIMGWTFFTPKGQTIHISKDYVHIHSDGTVTVLDMVKTSYSDRPDKNFAGYFIKDKFHDIHEYMGPYPHVIAGVRCRCPRPPFGKSYTIADA